MKPLFAFIHVILISILQITLISLTVACSIYLYSVFQDPLKDSKEQKVIDSKRQEKIAIGIEEGRIS